jgi:hypothetical protein
MTLKGNKTTSDISEERKLRRRTRKAVSLNVFNGSSYNTPILSIEMTTAFLPASAISQEMDTASEDIR